MRSARLRSRPFTNKKRENHVSRFLGSSRNFETWYSEVERAAETDDVGVPNSIGPGRRAVEIQNSFLSREHIAQSFQPPTKVPGLHPFDAETNDAAELVQLGAVRRAARGKAGEACLCVGKTARRIKKCAVVGEGHPQSTAKRSEQLVLAGIGPARSREVGCAPAPASATYVGFPAEHEGISLPILANVNATKNSRGSCLAGDRMHRCGEVAFTPADVTAQIEAAPIENWC